MGFDYFYGRGTEQFAFYQVPKMLIADDRFAGITMDSKFLYSLLLDRSSLSAKNGWLDEEGKNQITDGLYRGTVRPGFQGHEPAD